jgi:hypothetical protein
MTGRASESDEVSLEDEHGRVLIGITQPITQSSLLLHSKDILRARRPVLVSTPILPALPTRLFFFASVLAGTLSN